jgi:hypothetical protein
VTLTLNTWGTDADGGRRVISTQTVQQVDCMVQPDRPEKLVSIDPETGLRRITEAVKASIIFPENPCTNVDDTITWVDSDGGSDAETHIYQVKSRRDPAGLRSIWEVICEERI